MLPAGEIPELTEGYEGFYHLLHIDGGCEEATMSFIIRDHDMSLFENRKAAFVEVARRLNEKYGEGTVVCEVKASYYNMREMIEKRMEIVERAKKAFEECNVVAKIVPIRGGTDGARLSYEGLLCPNLSTGGCNFHGKYEFISVQSMEKMVQVLKCLVSAN